MDLATIERLLKSDGEVIPYVLEQWATKTPDKTCIFYGEENRHISYKEFNEIANSIANSLIAKGVKKGDRISVFLNYHHPVLSIMSMFGIWKTGAIYSPINCSFFGRLLAYQLNDTDPKFLITENDFIQRLNDIKDDIKPLEILLHSPLEKDRAYNPETANLKLDSKFKVDSFSSFFNGARNNPGVELAYYDDANIFYTSGTTGPAKGVLQAYRWMNQYTIGWRNNCNSDDVIYNDLPMYHVGGAIQNIVRAVWRGCTAAIWDRFSPTEFWGRIKACNATNAILLDVMITWLLNNPVKPDDHLNTLNKVYMQPMPLNHNEIARRFGFDVVLTGFGQTEAGSAISGLFFELDEGEGTPPEMYHGASREHIIKAAEKYGTVIVSGKEKLKKGYMGRPRFFVEAAILNDYDEPLQNGEVGQICFRSYLPCTIFKEYYGKPEATVKEFRNLWFHTGDVGYKDADGILYFVDRSGGFIRRRGENISSYQIEDIINSNAKVNSCAAFPIPAQEGDEDDIVVYVVNQPGENFDEKDLRAWLEANMPKYMRPQYIRFVDELPRTPTNKMEKYKLKEAILKELQR